METEKKQFTFKGKTIDELKTLDVREFAKFVKSRTRRTLLRQFQEIENFVIFFVIIIFSTSINIKR
jgi:hypothetical protein